MICPKCGKDMGMSEYCSNCNSYPYKEKEAYRKKKRFKIYIITIILAFIIFLGLTIGISYIYEKYSDKKSAINAYNEIYQAYSNEEYYSALLDIKKFQKHHGDKDKETTEMVEALYSEIEEKMFSKINTETDHEKIETNCSNYIENFPDGKYIEKVNEQYSSISNTLAPIRIRQAKEYISNDEYIIADNLLDSIINNDKISKNYINEAKNIKENISEIVKYETPVSVDIKSLLADATWYNMRKVNLSTDVIVANVDRERKMLYVYPVSDSSLGFDYSFPLEIYYGNLSNQSRWGSISSDDGVKLTYVSGRFKIYANRSNSGYIDAESIS